MSTRAASHDDRPPAAIHITAAALAAIDAHARAELPRECCGLLVGGIDERATGAAAAAAAADSLPSLLREPLRKPADAHALPSPDERLPAFMLRVERAVAARNVAPEPTRRYLIDPADHFRLIRELRHTSTDSAHVSDLAIVGGYHSHPGSRPAPSPTDLADAFPNFVYVIASPRPGGDGCEARAWWLIDGNFQEIPLVISS